MNWRTLVACGFLSLFVACYGCRTADREEAPKASPTAQAPVEPGPEAVAEAPPTRPEHRETEPAGAPKGPATSKDSGKAPSEEFEFTIEEFASFGRAFAEALEGGSGDAFCLSVDDVNELHTKPTASIIQIGRDNWFKRLRPEIEGAAVKFVEARLGPQFSQSLTPVEPGPYRIQVPQVTDLILELTIDGDPVALVVRRMYLLVEGWKIFDAVLER